MRITTCLLTITLASSVLAEDKPFEYTILYTGRLLGYARTPDSQVSNLAPAPLNREPNEVAKAYAKLFKSAENKCADNGPVLRLGMGDNFAPELLARTVQQKAGDFYPALRSDGTCNVSIIRVPKDRFPAPENTTQMKDLERKGAVFDNVAQFFIDSEYNAIVPGKHGFYLGPERLRSVAHLLEQNEVHMLGANLIISTARPPKPANTFPRTPERLKPPESYLTDWGDVTPDFPPVILPYKQQFLVRNAWAAGKRVVVSEPEIWVEAGPISSGDPADVFTGSSYKLVPADDACLAPVHAHVVATCRSLREKLKRATPTDRIYLFESAEGSLKAGLNHAFCAKLNGATVRTCVPFSVELPFLSYRDESDVAHLPKPYTLVAGKVAVFGVVDADLLTNVGMLNAGWINEKDKWDTASKVAPADYSLQQALEQCNADESCERAPKVLMAQMSHAKASQLIAQMGGVFDVVLSQADKIHSTGQVDLVEHIPVSQTGRRNNSKFVLTPPEPFTEGDDPKSPDPSFTPQLSRAKVKMAGLSQDLHNTLDSAVAASLELPKCAHMTLLDLNSASRTALSWLHLRPSGSSGDLADLALAVMQREFRTDVAMLQKRDLFTAGSKNGLSADAVPLGEIQNQINRVFWKGDFVVPLHVTGATLKKLLKQSKKFEELDHDLLSTEIERGRSLLVAGIWKDPQNSDGYYVNGAPLADSKLYTVAATEFLAVGDTGFSDLAAPDVPPATRLKEFEKSQLLSTLVCKQIQGSQPKGAVECDGDGELVTQRFLPYSSEKPFDSTSGFDAVTHYTTLARRFLAIPVPGSGSKAKGSELEKRLEQHRFWTVNLESLDFGYGGTYISRVGQAPAKFAGVSAPGVTTSGSNNLSADHKLRAIYDFGPGTWYMLSDSAFAKTNSSTASFASIATNLWGVEGGGTFRLHPLHRPSWLSLQYAGRFEGQLTGPTPTSIKLSAGSTLFLPSPQTSNVYGRVGLRAEFGDVYLEAGLEEIDSQHVLAAYEFTTPNGLVVCSPQSGVQFSCSGGSAPGPIIMDGDLAAPNLTAKPMLTDYLTGGAYLNFNIKFPLWSRRAADGSDQSWYFTLTNKGDLYFNSRNDTSVQTRYLEKLTPSFSIPIYGKLTLTPKVDFVLYEDKVAHRRFASATPALALSYSFNYREGMHFWSSMRYGAITQAQPVSK